jgi:hypothetical protein
MFTNNSTPCTVLYYKNKGDSGIGGSRLAKNTVNIVQNITEILLKVALNTIIRGLFPILNQLHTVQSETES